MCVNAKQELLPCLYFRHTGDGGHTGQLDCVHFSQTQSKKHATAPALIAEQCLALVTERLNECLRVNGKDSKQRKTKVEC